MSSTRGIFRYFFYAYFPVLALTLRFLPFAEVHDPLQGVFFLAAAIFQSGIYLLPAFFLCLVVRVCGLWLQPRIHRVLMGFSLILSYTFTLLYIDADYSIFRLYGYHINGFVFNLILTPGGVASLGVTPETWRSVALLTLAAFAVAGFFLLLSLRWLQSASRQHSHLVSLSLWILACGLFEMVTFGIQDIRSATGYLLVENRLPFYQPLTFKRLGQSLGYVNKSRSNRDDVENPKLSVAHISQVNYPLNPMRVLPPAEPLNLVWLVGESLRWDLLNPEIMPRTWQFAQNNHRFTQHYSGGNRTRMGMFTMFYGIEGPYWFTFLKEHISPVLLNALQSQGYDLELYTSANFSYPEFDQTLFSRVPAQHLHEDSEGPGWQRDRHNVTALLDSLDNHDINQPFMRFMFFESTHAPYLFPEEIAIRSDYADQLDYTKIADASPHEIRQVFNRYLNAAHHLDSQIQRILDYLERKHLSENTVVIITGDHGEAFMENGRWGHGSDFTDPQIRVPLILRIPGSGHFVHDKLTSHLDIIPSISRLFGITNPVSDYSNGINVFSDQLRNSIVVSDWSGIAFLNEHYLVRVPLKTTGYFSGGITDRQGRRLDDLTTFNQIELPSLLTTLKSLNRFSSR